MPFSGARDDENTDRTPIYLRTMDVDVKISIKMKIIHGEQCTRQLENLILEGLKYLLKRLLITLKFI